MIGVKYQTLPASARSGRDGGERRLQTALMRLKTAHRFLPESGMGGAIEYALGQWAGLEVWLGEGRVRSTTTWSKTPSVLQRLAKNWLFRGSADAGEHGAILYTLIENCRREEVDPFAYLRDVLSRLPSMTNQQKRGNDSRSLGAHPARQAATPHCIDVEAKQLRHRRSRPSQNCRQAALRVTLTIKSRPMFIEELTVLLQALIAVVLGGLLGWEREASGKWAGLRTHILVWIR